MVLASGPLGGPFLSPSSPTIANQQCALLTSRYLILLSKTTEAHFKRLWPTSAAGLAQCGAAECIHLLSTVMNASQMAEHAFYT